MKFRLLGELMRSSDVVSLHVPMTEKTKNILKRFMQGLSGSPLANVLSSYGDGNGNRAATKFRFDSTTPTFSVPGKKLRVSLLQLGRCAGDGSC